MGLLPCQGKSTTAALLSFSHDCLQSLDNKTEIHPVFFDIGKALDSVPHALLQTVDNNISRCWEAEGFGQPKHMQMESKSRCKSM